MALKTCTSLVLVFVCISIVPIKVNAISVTYDFYSISKNNPENVARSESQIHLDVIESGDDALFVFRNDGPAPGVITNIYFDDDELLSRARLIDADDGIAGHEFVDFSLTARPPRLPGGNRLDHPFKVTESFSADSYPSKRVTGVGSSEWLGIIFNLQGQSTYQDVVGDMLTGTLRVGIHVQGFAGGRRGIFLNRDAPVPEPMTAVGIMIGINGLVGYRRCRRKK